MMQIEGHTIIPGAGHFLHMERPSEYRRAVEDWLSAFNP